MRIGAKITGMAVLPIVVTSVVILVIALYQKEVLEEFFSRAVEEQAQDEAQKIARNVYLLCRSAQESVQNTVDANLRVAEDVLRDSGRVSFGREPVAWTAVNQFTHKTQGVVLPRMLVGGRWLGQGKDLRKPSLVVDDVKKLVGGTATIFQRMNEAGDMLRVATNVKNVDGSRAIGTYIPALNPDGTANPVIAALLRGGSFRGRAYVVNDWYVTAYRPIWDETGKRVVGALYVGVKQENVGSLRKGIMDIVVGKSGYVFVVGGSGEQRGRYIISHRGERDGENVLSAVDAEGRPFVQEMINKALSLKDRAGDGFADIASVHHPWRDAPGPSPRQKTAAVTYFAPWDWVIGASYYDSDFSEARRRMAAPLHTMAKWVAVASLVMILLSLPAGYLVARGIRNRINSVLRSVSDALVVTDIHDRIVLLNPAAESLFKTRTKKVRHRSVVDIIENTVLLQLFTDALAQRRSGITFDFEVEREAKRRAMRGQTLIMEGEAGGFAGMVTIIRDVTGEHEVERLKSDFISMAAHELGTPLAAIVGYSEMLLQQQTYDPAFFREALTYLNTKAWGLSRIVDEILDLNRIESGSGLPVHREKCDVNEIVRESLTYGRNLSRIHSFLLELPDTSVMLWVDRQKIAQVVENLLSNAVKFTPGGGVIDIRAEVVEGRYRLLVEDNGIGMTPEETSKVFDKFYRADSSTTAKEGTGLGMSIVKLIVEAHGGSVWVESEQGTGTRVYVTLPLEGGELA
ncbi:MAG TPA: Cache 3/Cache 2 fusion domain-containing protein [Geobacteraceae bacterium]